MSEFSLRLKLLMGGKTQKQFAESIGDDQEKLSKYLNDVQQPGFVFLQRMSQAGYNVNWLLTGKGGMYLSDAAATDVAPETMRVAEGLQKYPELLAPVSDAIQLKEEMQRRIDALKEQGYPDMKYPKGKKKDGHRNPP